MGDTGIGVHGAKYLVRSNGQKSAHPRPPSVSVSSSAWLATTSVAVTPVRIAGLRTTRAATPIATPMANAKANECVAPR
jgi:hypothetical protein